MKESNSFDIVEIVKNYGNLTVIESRKVFDQLEGGLLEFEQIPDDTYQLKEYYSGGMYCREITIPEGAFITGRIYKFDHIEIMLSGEIEILSADGGKTYYEGHNVIEAKAGKRQGGLAHKETKWLTINCIPDYLPINEALDFTSVLTYKEYKDFHDQLNNADYEYFLNEIGLSHDEMEAIVNTDDVIQLPVGYEHIEVLSSSISGDGLFTLKEIKAGDLICPVRIKEKRTIAGRYSNHALHSNTKPVVEGNVFYVMANKDIQANEEITMNYRDILSFRNQQGDLSCQVG